jgi:transcriptional regulator GlxA family with amidase domain
MRSRFTVNHSAYRSLARAADYLRTTNAGPGEIARLTGYESDVSISKAFRRQYGRPPGAYRKEAAADEERAASTRSAGRRSERSAS